MPGITEKEKFRRYHLIGELLEEGKTQLEISKELGLPIATIQRNCQYLKDLAQSDITPKEKAEKRSELYLILGETIEEMQKQYEKYIEKENPGTARDFIITKLSAIDKQMEMYGLKIKDTKGVQLNQQFNIPPEKINSVVGAKITKELIKQHEDRVANAD